jgi:hypothetical protein
MRCWWSQVVVVRIKTFSIVQFAERSSRGGFQGDHRAERGWSGSEYIFRGWLVIMWEALQIWAVRIIPFKKYILMETLTQSSAQKIFLFLLIFCMIMTLTPSLAFITRFLQLPHQPLDVSVFSKNAQRAWYVYLNLKIYLAGKLILVDGCHDEICDQPLQLIVK